MTPKQISKLWYENNSKGYTIAQVNYSDHCFAAEDDDFQIQFSFPLDPDRVQLNYKGSNGNYSKFWNGANARYDPLLGVITGSSTITFPDGTQQTRPFSIALDRSVFAAAFRIHVYVGARAGGSPQPDDGSWTGNGK